MARKGPKEKLLLSVTEINDTPCTCKRSDIGIAMGGLGSDAALKQRISLSWVDKPSRLERACK